MLSSAFVLLIVAGDTLRGDVLAHCGDCAHPRTPVQWGDESSSCGDDVVVTPCMTLVDRSVAPVLHVPYSIPFEDAEVPAQEVADSRTHQFFAFCRQHHARSWLPSWITLADVDAAVALQLIEPPVAPEDVLAQSIAWQRCWSRVNADAERRPITCEMAQAGIDWDTATVDPGVYVLDGYTWEPPFDIWWPRPGVVKVHDGDPDAVGPAAAISALPEALYRDELVAISACVDAIDGASFRLSWALAPEQGEPQWHELLAATPVVGDTIEASVPVPAPLFGEDGLLRLDVEDPLGRTYVAYPRNTMLVIDADTPSGESSSSTSSSTAAAESSSTSSETGIEHGTAPELDPSPSRGCACNATAPELPPLVAILVVVAARRGRRRLSNPRCRTAARR